MKSAKTRHKAREPPPNVFPTNLDIIFQVVPLTDAKVLLQCVNNANQLRDALHAFLTNPKINGIYRPVRLGALPISASYSGNLTANYMTSQQQVEQDTVFVNQTAINQQDLIHLPGEFVPETDLWYAALLDYLMEVVYWSVNDWIPGCKADSPENFGHSYLLIDESAVIKTPEDERAVGVSTALATNLVLIVHLQFWSNSGKQITKLMQQNPLKTIKTSSLVATLHLVKQLFQKLPNSNQPLDCKTVGLEQFASYHYGMLGVLNVKASIRLVRFLTEHFLHLHRLVEKNFGLSVEGRQKLMEIPCHLEVNTLLRRFGPTRSFWPPPLCEALPLSLVASYPHLFDERVVKWLACMPSVCKLETKDVISKPTTPVANLPELVVEPDPPIPMFPLDKYLTTLDSMELGQLKALASISVDQTDDMVRSVISDVQNTQQQQKSKIFDLVVDKLKQTQTTLARQLVERANQKLHELRIKSAQRRFVK